MVQKKCLKWTLSIFDKMERIMHGLSKYEKEKRKAYIYRPLYILLEVYIAILYIKKCEWVSSNSPFDIMKFDLSESP